MIFCDTSTLAKLYAPEKESTAVQRLLESEDEVCASELARAELMAVFHRRLREAKWTKAEFDIAVRQFTNDDLGGFWTWLPLDRHVVEATTRMYATLPADLCVRCADCIHLVTAVRHRFSEVHTHDQHQAKACSAFGLEPVTIAAGE